VDLEGQHTNRFILVDGHSVRYDRW
jgi:hypothetical protein